MRKLLILLMLVVFTSFASAEILYVSQDTGTSENDPNKNYGNASRVLVRSRGGGLNSDIYLGFNKNITGDVTNAVLYYYINETFTLSDQINITFNITNGSFDEDTLVYSNVSSYLTDFSTAIHKENLLNYSSSGVWKIINLTENYNILNDDFVIKISTDPKEYGVINYGFFVGMRESSFHTPYINYTVANSSNIQITFVNEETGANINETINIDIYSNAIAYNYSINNSVLNINNLPVGDYTVNYRSSNFGDRTRYISIESGVSNKYYKFYMLETSISQNSIIRVIDEDSNVIQDLKIIILREINPINGSFFAVNELFTNFEGETISDFKRNTVNYKFQFWYNDILIETTSKTLIFQDELTHQIALTQDELTSFKYYLSGASFLSGPTNISGKICYDFTYSGPEIVGGKVLVYKRVLSSNDILETENISSNAADTISVCFTPENNARYFIEGFIDTSTAGSWYKDASKEYINQNSTQILGVLGIFLTLVFVGVFASMFSQHPSMTAAMSIVALAISSSIGFINIEWGYIVLLASVAGVIIFSRVK